MTCQRMWLVHSIERRSRFMVHTRGGTFLTRDLRSTTMVHELICVRYRPRPCAQGWSARHALSARVDRAMIYAPMRPASHAGSARGLVGWGLQAPSLPVARLQQVAPE